MADTMQLFKYIVKNVAAAHGKSATFMPKPLFGDNGSGMHTHQSLWKNGQPLFAGDGYAGLSEMALHYIGGLLKHTPDPVSTPWVLPPRIVFFTTTAKLGPGEAAPVAQTAAIANHEPSSTKEG
jgi:hypothetical protein